MHRRGQRVDVGPRTLFHVGRFGVLLDRRIAGLQDHRQRLRHVADDAARGAEIEQQRFAGAAEQDHVVRRDVAVKATLGVNHRQRFRQRRQQRHQPRLVGRRAHRTQLVLERDAFVKRHHHVGGAVGLPEPVHLDERRMVELRQQLGLVDEALQSGIEGVAVPRRFDLHLRLADPRRQRGRHVLFQRHAAFERMVPSEVDDAEAAFSEHAGQLELAEVGAHRQRVAAVAGAGGGVVAGRHVRGVAGRIGWRAR